MHVFAIESYGTRIRIESNRKRMIDRARVLAERTMLGRIRIIDPESADHVFRIIENDAQTVLELDEEVISQSPSPRMIVNYFETRLRLAIGEYADKVVFVHAGVVEHEGGAIILPGFSNSGKTTLVAELVQRGAGYLSDEYAIFDSDGNVQPFPRPLSFRDAFRVSGRRNIAPRSFGRVARDAAYPVKTVAFVNFRSGGTWEPQIVTPGNAALMMIEHTLPIRSNTGFVLGVMRRVTDGAICIAGERGDAGDCADELLRLFDNKEK